MANEATKVEESKESKEVKFTDDELKSLQGLQTNYQEERDLVKTLNDKYGPGQLDPATGVFTPSN